MDANIIQILQEVNKDGQRSKILKLVKIFAMVLLNKLDFSLKTIGKILDVSRKTVSFWCNRFKIDPYGGLKDLPRSYYFRKIIGCILKYESERVC